MKRMMIIALIVLLAVTVLVAGCSGSANSNYRSQQQDAYNAPQGQYAGGCGVTAPADVDNDLSRVDSESAF